MARWGGVSGPVTPFGRTRAACNVDDAELLHVMMPPDQVDPPVAGLWSVLFEVRAQQPVPTPWFTVELPDVPAHVRGGWDSGEFLAAVTVDDGRDQVSVGGPDLDGLAYFAADEDRPVPSRWEPALRAGDDGAPHPCIEQSGTCGLTWQLPQLHAGDVLDLCISVAWAPISSDDDAATWVAVNGPRNVRRQLYGRQRSRKVGRRRERSARPGP